MTTQQNLVAMAETRFRPARVALCGKCNLYCGEDEAGFDCPGNHDDERRQPRLRLRVGYVCLRCEVQPFFPTRDQMLDHQRDHDEEKL